MLCFNTRTVEVRSPFLSFYGDGMGSRGFKAIKRDSLPQLPSFMGCYVIKELVTNIKFKLKNGNYVRLFWHIAVWSAGSFIMTPVKAHHDRIVWRRDTDALNIITLYNSEPPVPFSDPQFSVQTPSVSFQIKPQPRFCLFRRAQICPFTTAGPFLLYFVDSCPLFHPLAIAATLLVQNKKEKESLKRQSG